MVRTRAAGSGKRASRSWRTPSDTATMASARGYRRAISRGSRRRRLRSAAPAVEAPTWMCSDTTTRVGPPARCRAASPITFGHSPPLSSAAGRSRLRYRTSAGSASGTNQRLCRRTPGRAASRGASSSRRTPGGRPSAGAWPRGASRSTAWPAAANSAARFSIRRWIAPRGQDDTKTAIRATAQPAGCLKLPAAAPSSRSR